MDALIGFYSTPTGQKMLQELPAVMSEGMEAMMPILAQERQPDNGARPARDR